MRILKSWNRRTKQTQSELRDVISAVRQITFETQRRLDNEAHEREKMELRLQLAASNSDRALLPADKKDEETIRQLQEQMTALRTDVQELERRISGIERRLTSE